MKALEEKYLEGLSELFPSIAAASTEIINLQAIVNLPKGTEHFLTDIHGEYEAFAHVLKNGSASLLSTPMPKAEVATMILTLSLMKAS